VGEGNKNGKTSIWIYAVVLFTSAFIVLLLTAMSQIRFNKHIADFKNQIYTKEDEKNKFKSNLTIAIEENAKLSSEVEFLNDQIENLKNKLKESESKSEDKINEYKKISEIYKAVLLADLEYEKGNYTECAKILYKQGNEPNIPDATIKERYRFLVDKTYKKAAYQFYREGYKSYKQGDYKSAEESFQMSVNLTDKEYFSDDCYYLMMYIKYKNNDVTSMRSIINILKTKYPDSNYIDDAKYLLEKAEKKNR